LTEKEDPEVLVRVNTAHNDWNLGDQFVAKQSVVQPWLDNGYMVLLATIGSGVETREEETDSGQVNSQRRTGRQNKVESRSGSGAPTGEGDPASVGS